MVIVVRVLIQGGVEPPQSKVPLAHAPLSRDGTRRVRPPCPCHPAEIRKFGKRNGLQRASLLLRGGQNQREIAQ
jgi:hypothetical protein